MTDIIGTDFAALANDKLKHNLQSSGKYSLKAFIKEFYQWFVLKILDIFEFGIKFFVDIEEYFLGLKDDFFKNLFWGRQTDTLSLVKSALIFVAFFLVVLDLIFPRTKASIAYSGGANVEHLNVGVYSSADLYADRLVETSTLETLVQSNSYRMDVDYYVVKRGDTISGIAKKFGVSIDTLLWANKLRDNAVLKVGQKLKIPPGDGILYKVKKGDTIAKIAKKYSKYHTAPQAIMEANWLGSDEDLKELVGKEIFVPTETVPHVPKPTPVYARRPASTSRSRSSPYKKPSNYKPPSAKRFLSWPVKDHGYVSQRFWSRHHGIDIANNSTTWKKYGGHPPILAAADGRVVFAGYVCNAYRCGYAWMINIDHGNGYSTLYAHLQPGSLKVKKGDWVVRGQEIARMGESGWAYGIHLHFEVGKGNYGSRRTLYDPLAFMR